MPTEEETSTGVVDEQSAKKVETLHKFLNDLYADKICFKISDGEASDIRQSVTQMISKIVKKIETIDARLKIGEVVLVGSAGEGTQIVQPEEYDFVLTLELFSDPGVLCVTNKCRNRNNYAHVTIKDDKLKKLFKDILHHDELRSTQNDRHFLWKEGLRQIFRHALTKAMHACSSDVLNTSTGTLRLENCALKMHGPALTPKFQWYGRNGKKMEISVDLCPVIKLYGDFPDLIKSENVSCQTYYDYAQKVGSVMLLPCKEGVSCQDGLCFSIIFTESELLLMKDLSEHHRRCYKILKYLLNAKQRPSLGSKLEWINNIVEPPTAVFSYALKILVLNHHYKQQCAEKRNFSGCVLKLLLEIDSILHAAPFVIPGIPPRHQLSGPFFNTYNIWSDHNLKFADSYLQLKLRLVIINLLSISEIKNYKYENWMVSSVRGTDVNMLARPLSNAILCCIICLYFYPEISHFMEDIFTFLLKKYFDLGKIIWTLTRPMDSKYKERFISSQKTEESGLSRAGIYFMTAVEFSVFSIWVYPELGHLAEDVSKLLSWKFMDLVKQI